MSAPDFIIRARTGAPPPFSKENTHHEKHSTAKGNKKARVNELKAQFLEKAKKKTSLFFFEKY